ncbi:hypothetical protein GQX74_000993 [Glossina fuscipes]|nr:hypothetical protein GQX74_000993 [Glossina fuscipes]
MEGTMDDSLYNDLGRPDTIYNFKEDYLLKTSTTEGTLIYYYLSSKICASTKLTLVYGTLLPFVSSSVHPPGVVALPLPDFVVVLTCCCCCCCEVDGCSLSVDCCCCKKLDEEVGILLTLARAISVLLTAPVTLTPPPDEDDDEGAICAEVCIVLSAEILRGLKGGISDIFVVVAVVNGGCGGGGGGDGGSSGSGGDEEAKIG